MSSKKNLEKLRDEIDKIDDKLLNLINKRGTLALEISKHKKENSLRVYDPAREKEIEDKLADKNTGPLTNEDVISVFREVISGCRALQHDTKIAYLGPEGSFSNQAAFHKFGGAVDLVPVFTFQEVFEEVHRQKVEYGIVPVENSIEGSIGGVLDMLFEWDLKISAEYYERISHFLLSREGELSKIKIVASHPQAIGQCRNWLSKNLKNIEILETPSTAAAAKMAAEDGSVAAIASEFSLSIYGLKTIQSHIEDSLLNTTRFLVISRHGSSYTGNDKTSIVFSIRDEPGALQKSFFQPISKAGINLTKIESRPSKNRPWEYMFFADFLGHIEEENIKSILNKIKNNCIFLKVLGSYPVVKFSY